LPRQSLNVSVVLRLFPSAAGIAGLSGLKGHCFSLLSMGAAAVLYVAEGSMLSKKSPQIACEMKNAQQKNQAGAILESMFHIRDP